MRWAAWCCQPPFISSLRGYSKYPKGFKRPFKKSRSASTGFQNSPKVHRPRTSQSPRSHVGNIHWKKQVGPSRCFPTYAKAKHGSADISISTTQYWGFLKSGVPQIIQVIRPFLVESWNPWFRGFPIFRTYPYIYIIIYIIYSLYIKLYVVYLCVF